MRMDEDIVVSPCCSLFFVVLLEEEPPFYRFQDSTSLNVSINGPLPKLKRQLLAINGWPTVSIWEITDILSFNHFRFEH